MRSAVDEHGWDGDWFRARLRRLRRPIGSASDCDEGQIFIEPQGICVHGRHRAADGRAAHALARCAERLATPHGIVLHQPAYQRYHLRAGRDLLLPARLQGERRHLLPHQPLGDDRARRSWVTATRALDYYLRTNPSAREAISEIHRCEPYVHAQMIAGRDAPTHGEAKNSWLTGTAAWNYVAVTQWILGIRPDHDGLRIDPRLPADWGDVRVTRRFRGTTYRIAIRKQRGVVARVTHLVVDGRVVAGTLVPLPASPGGVVLVEGCAEPAPRPAADGSGLTLPHPDRRRATRHGRA